MIDHDTRFIFFLSRLFLFFSFSFFFHRLDSIQWILLVIYNTMEITFPYIILYFRNVRGSTHHFKLAYQHAIDPYDSFIIFQTIQLPWFRMKRKNNSHRYHWTSRINRLHVTFNIQIYPISSQKDLSDPSELEKSLSISFSPDALRIRLSSIHPFQITKLSNVGNRSTRWPLLITKTAYVPRF